MNKEILIRITYYTEQGRDDTWMAKGKVGIALQFLGSKNKKGKQWKEKQRVWKQELLKSCQQAQNVTVLVMFTVLF